MNDAMGDTPVIERRKPSAKPKGGMTPAKRRAATAKLTETLAAKKAAQQERPVVHAEPGVRRQAPRSPSRVEGSRDLARETPRRGAAVAVGHGGERLTRRRTIVGDKFEVPQNEVPQGWTYQWNTVTVLNQSLKEIERGDLQMHENGWRPVPASRHPGRWAPTGYEGSVIIDGLRLEERPASLTQEAKMEDTALAKAQVRDRTDALRLTQKQLPGAGQASASRAGPQMGMRMSIDPALDIPRPQHEIDGGDDGFEE